MSNREVHALAAIPAGGLCAAYQARNQTAPGQVIEVFGGLLGGYAGGRFPDLIDPPVCPDHRGIGHSIFSITIAGTIIYKKLSDWQDWFRNLADEARLRADSAQDDFWKGVFRLAEFLLRFVAGLIAGVIGGYASHLALDFMTPCSLPLVARGF